MKKVLSILLCLVMLLALAACGGDQADTTEGTTTAPTAEATEPVTEPTVPQLEIAEKPILDADGNVHMYYDDQLKAAKIVEGATTVEILSQTPASKKVGTDTPDDAVLMLVEGSNTLIAVGTGTATVSIDGTEYSVIVEAAPISLFMITGHSLGEGSKGEAAAGVACPAGQTYSSHKEIVTADGAISGLGVGSEVRPLDIDGFQMSGRGTPGEGSGLAYRWNQLTGEKIWVINVAVGGSCLNEWVQGTENYNNAVSLYRQAAEILQNESAAGHYVLKDTVVIYHSGANFSFKNVTFDNALLEEWYSSMWNGYKQDLAMDINGDGTDETVGSMGLVLARTTTNKDEYFITDFCANYFMAGSDLYPDMFMASHGAQDWTTNEGVRNNFPEIDYETHGFEVKKPNTVQDIYADDIHLQQVAYNAIGMNIADNTFRNLRTENPVVSLKVLGPTGKEIGDTLEFSRKGVEYQIALLPEPLCASDLTITLSDNLEMAYPFVIKDVGTGTGTITISQGDTVLKTITVKIAE